MKEQHIKLYIVLTLSALFIISINFFLKSEQNSYHTSKYPTYKDEITTLSDTIISYFHFDNY